MILATIILTIIITTAIVWTRNWIIKNRETHPEIYKSRNLLGAVIYIILNL